MSLIHIHPREQPLWMKNNARKANKTVGENCLKSLASLYATHGRCHSTGCDGGSWNRRATRQLPTSVREGLVSRHWGEDAPQPGQIASNFGARDLPTE